MSKIKLNCDNPQEAWIVKQVGWLCECNDQVRKLYVNTSANMPVGTACILVSPADRDNKGSGFAPFTRSYVAKCGAPVQVELNASPVPQGFTFVRWLQNGKTFSTGPDIIITLGKDPITMTAEYAGGGSIYRIVNVSTSPNVPTGTAQILMSPSDKDGQGSGMAPFTRKFNMSEPHQLELNAYPLPSGMSFAHWLKNGVVMSIEPDIVINLDNPNISMVAEYSGSGPQPTDKFIPGNPQKDGNTDGTEVYKNVGPIELRCDVNDASKTPEVVADNFFFALNSLVDSAGALTCTIKDNIATIVAKDYVSPKTGIYHRHLGFTYYRSANPLLRVHTLVIDTTKEPPTSDANTVRSYWGTIATPPPPSPIKWDHLIGGGMFLGLMPWKDNSGIYNDAPKNMKTLLSQFANAGGNLMQWQLLYEEGALFVLGRGLTLDASKVAYSVDLITAARQCGVGVLLVLFEHCSLKYPDKWNISPLNSRNGGPFGSPFDIYKNPQTVVPYVREVVAKLGAANVAYEIFNEGGEIPESESFAAQVRDTLKSLGISRISTSGSNPGGLWRFSEHSAVNPSFVKSGQLPNTDGETWDINNVSLICNAVRATAESGLVFDGVCDARHNWAEFLSKLGGSTPSKLVDPPTFTDFRIAVL